MPRPFVPRLQQAHLGFLRRVPRFGRLIGMLLLTACVGTTDPAANLVTIEAPDFTVPLAGTLQLELFATNASGERLPITAVSWSSDNVAVAPVGTTGLVEGRSFGSATITATRGGSSDAVVVTVKPAAIEFSVSGERIMAAGATITVAARAIDALGRTIPSSDATLTWTSSNETIAVVRADHGEAVVTGVDLGLTTIVASAFGLSQSVGIVVLPAGSDASASVRVEELRVLEIPGARLSPQAFAPVMRVMMRNQGEPLQLARIDLAIAGIVATLPARCTATDFVPGETWDMFGFDHFMVEPFTYSAGTGRVRAGDVLALLTFRTTTGAVRGLAAIGLVESGIPPLTNYRSPALTDC